MYVAKNYEHLLGTPGFSDTALKNHFTLYGGYVTNANKLSDTLKSLEQTDKMATPEFAELKRRFGWEFNGMRLHEIYFGGMTKEQTEFASSFALHKIITEEYGSVAAWEKHFKAVGVMRGFGWVILYYDEAVEKPLTVWVNEHDVGHLAGVKPLIAMDVFEHAFMPDYGLKRVEYVAAFWKAIDWQAAENRL